MRTVRLVLRVLLIALLLTIAGFLVWASITPSPSQAALDALQSDESVTVTTDPWVMFTPTGAAPSTGFIFYPGGRVSAQSYAVPLRAIAAAGYRVIAVPMPLNLAILGVNTADSVIAAYPEVGHWAIGGHSLGGSMAGRYAHDHSDTIGGLVLWAAFVEDSYSLRGSDVLVTSISGENDGLATPEEIDAARTALPEDARFVIIPGGNHGQFGDYGDQAGDNPAAISRDAQQAQAVAATVELLRALDGSNE